MKIRAPLIALSIFGCFQTCMGADVEPVIPPNFARVQEHFTAKVLKVYFVKDGEFIYISYLVKWKNQEVVVSDSLRRKIYRENDEIEIFFAKRPPQEGMTAGVLTFYVGPEKQSKGVRTDEAAWPRK